MEKDANLLNSHAVNGGVKTKGVRAHSQTDTKPDNGASEPCTICLQAITERAVAVPCNHLTFDFLCLVSWLQERDKCPLCKATVTEVQYDWTNVDDYKTYLVPAADPIKRNSHWRHRRLSHENARQRDVWVSRQVRDVTVRSNESNPALERRQSVYRHRLYALHVGANRLSQHRDLKHAEFAGSVEMQSRARTFLRRELRVFAFLDPAVAKHGQRSREYLVEYIVFILKTNDPKGADGRAEDLLTDFLGKENARQLLHEVESWLRSPYARLEEWDKNAQYAESSRESKG